MSLTMASPRPDHPFLSGENHDDHFFEEEDDNETKHFDKYKVDVDGFLKIDGFSYKNSFPMVASASGDSIPMINDDVVSILHKSLRT